MEIFNVEQVDIHGGSFRVYIARIGSRKVAEVVSRLIKEEEKMRLYSHEVLLDFAGKVEQNRRELVWLLQTIKQKGQRIAGVSAPAKSNVPFRPGEIQTQEVEEWATNRNSSSSTTPLEGTFGHGGGPGYMPPEDRGRG